MATDVSRPDEVEQRERTHREVAAALHGGVDVVAGGRAVLEHAHGVVQVREQQRVDDEAGAVLDLDRRPCRTRSANAVAAAIGLVAGGERPHDLDQRHRRRRVEEVDAADLARDVRSATASSTTGRVDVLVARIASAWQQCVELGEQRLLDGEVLDDRLDDEVAVGEVAERGRGGDP